jgi:hypothetical protein
MSLHTLLLFYNWVQRYKKIKFPQSLRIKIKLESTHMQSKIPLEPCGYLPDYISSLQLIYILCLEHRK